MVVVRKQEGVAMSRDAEESGGGELGDLQHLHVPLNVQS